MTALRILAMALVVVLTAGPAFAKGGGGGAGGGAGGAGGAGAGGGNGGGNAGGNGGGNGGGNAGGNGNGVAGGQGNGNGPAVGAGHTPDTGHSVGAGRGTAITAPGSARRSDTATGRLSSPTPGKANPPSGVTPGFGHVGTVPTTPGHQAPSPETP